jgi:hypothetical protein
MTGYVPVHLQRHIRHQFENVCAYCHTAEALTATAFEIEHIIPRSQGGETSFENLCLSCPMCNRYKSTRSTAIDPLTQATVPLFHPQRDVWSDHFEWHADDTELRGSTPIGRATVQSLKMNRPSLVRVRRMWVAMDEHPPV